MQVKKRTSYNDGVVGIYKELSTLINTDFNAKTNAKSIKDYELITSMYYKEVSARDEDYMFAEAMGRNLTMKIKVPLVKNIKSNHTVLIDNQIYDIIKIDSNKINQELYILLEGGRTIEK